MDITRRAALPMLLSVLMAGCTPAAVSDPLPLIDAHSQVDHKVDLEKIVPLMDRAGIRRVILSTRGRVSPEQITSFAARNPGRITPSVRTKGRIYEQDSPKYYKLLRKQLGMPGFAAMAEVLMWHAQKGNKAGKIVVPPGDKRVRAALDGALAKGWPFVAHIEFAAAGGDGAVFMAKFESMLRAHPAHPFLLIHVGQLDPVEARRLIEAHPNVHFLTSHANPITVANSSQPWTNLFKGAALTPEWAALIVAHPDRFVLAFDNVWADHWGQQYVKQAALWQRALAALPDLVAHAVAHGNAERLWDLPPAQ